MRRAGGIQGNVTALCARGLAPGSALRAVRDDKGCAGR